MNPATFKKRLLLIIVLAISLLGLTELRSRSSPALAQRGTYTPCDFRGMIGTLRFVNDSRLEIKVRLWHSQSRTVFSTWTFGAGEAATLQYKGKPVSLGDDWGIQLGSSKVKCVGTVSGYENKVFEVTTSSFYR